MTILFNAPIGTTEERASAKLWPGYWIDACPFGTRYDSTGKWAIHTGSDLNLNVPHWNSDAHAPVYAPADGVIVAADLLPAWGKIVVVEVTLADGSRCWPRMAHLETILVKRGQAVKRGDMIGTVGNAEGRYPWHLHYDIGRNVDLGKKPADWPGDDLLRVRRDYVDPLAFTKEHHTSQPHPTAPLLVGLHDVEGGAWMKQRGIKGVCLALASVQDQPVQLDFTDLSTAGITVLLRVGWGYADGAGTLPRPDQLMQFEKAVAETVNAAKGVTATQYGNEINNASEAPGWNADAGKPGPDYFPLTPGYYIKSYNRVWGKVRKDAKMGPAALDPYFGPEFPFLAWDSDNREWWRAIMRGIAGADALFLHSKTQGPAASEIRSDAKFGSDPLRWQYLGFRAIEPYLAEVPAKYKELPVYITEANPQRKGDGSLGWDVNGDTWLSECVDYLKTWNSVAGHQPVSGSVFYRWDYDPWKMANRGALLDCIEREARKLDGSAG
jgi:hypothetical protein